MFPTTLSICNYAKNNLKQKIKSESVALLLSHVINMVQNVQKSYK